MKSDRAALRVLSLSVLCALPPAAAQEPAPAPAQGAPAAAPRYVRVGGAGAKLMNLADKGAEVVLAAAGGTLLAVHGERAGFLEVEPPSGLKVWVYGEYLKKAGASGVVEVTGNGVRMRPLPSSSEKSFPLAQQLGKGERLRVIARQDPARKLSEDWVQVWSPPGTRAFVAAGDVAPVEAGLDTRAAWAAAVKEATAAMSVVDLGASGAPARPVAAQEASAPKEPAPARNPAFGLLEEAEALFIAALASEKPDFAPAREAYGKVIAAAPKGASAETARARLDQIEAREGLARLKSDHEAYERKRQEELSRAEERLRDASRKQDPLWGRFQARGWLERDARAQSGSAERFVVRWGGRDVAELACASGRYDLADFVGYEIGVLGVTQRAATPGQDGLPGAPARIDAARIEVISARAAPR